MAGFEEVIERKTIVRALENAAKNEKASQGYLFYGPEGVGKKFIAEIFAQMIITRGLPIEGPIKDIIHVTHEKETLISVDEVREQINATVNIKPFKAKYKVYVIEDAELMNEQAQNAILKTIEEPPEYCKFIFIAKMSEVFLPTIISRLRLIEIPGVSDEAVIRHLTNETELDEREAANIAAVARGSLGTALNFARSEVFRDNFEKVIGHLKSRDKKEFSDRYSEIHELFSDKKSTGFVINIFLMWYRDVSVYKSGKDTKNIYFKNNIVEIKRQAGHYTYKEIFDYIKNINTVKQMISSNVKSDNAAELLV
ncbi:MAG: hypothetical protein K6F97_05455 [Lachnospiraceae bacterium]|nr:hypothetical protein [Lachnospiraceae bacterium]